MKKILALIGLVATSAALTGCGILDLAGTTNTDDKYADLFEDIEHGARTNIFTYADNDTQRIEGKITKLDNAISKGSNSLVISLYFNSFFSELLYVQEQYVIIHSYSMVFPNNTEMKEDVSFLLSYLLDLDRSRFDYLIQLYNSDKRADFFPDWENTDYSFLEDRDDLYDDEYYELEQSLATIELEYTSLLSVSERDYDALAVKLVEKVNVENSIATKLGYDNYIEYMYDQGLNREYEFEDLSILRTTAKLSLADTMIELREYTSSLELTSSEQADYERLSTGSFFDQREELDNLATEMGGDYLSNYNYFWEKGEYYFGTEDSFEAAYIQKTASSSFVMAYFGPGYYSQLQTVTHEVGHYMAALEDYDDGSYDNIDLCEFQAQANEMLLASYMYNNNPINKGYEAFVVEEIASALSTVIAALVVSDFEYAIYNTSNLSSSSISSIMANIYDEYGIEGYFRDSDEYWAATARYATGYYISYGISIIPSIELFFEGINDFSKAKTDYMIISKGQNEILPVIEQLNYSNPLTSNILSDLVDSSKSLIK